MNGKSEMMSLEFMEQNMGWTDRFNGYLLYLEH